MDKSHHYSAGPLKRQWDFAHSAIQGSNEIVVIGFSFPPTDISCQFLFKSALRPGTRVVVVNRDPAAKNRYDSILGGTEHIELDYSYTGGEDALRRYVKAEVFKSKGQDL